MANGVPALLLVIVLVVLLWRNQNIDTDAVARRYSKATQDAIKAKEYDQAELLLRKLLKLQPKDPSHKYFLAICWENKGNEHRAASIISQIAPHDTNGYAPAHYWMARKLMAKNDIRQTDRRTAQAIEHHLKASLKDTRVQNSVQMNLAQLYASQREYDKAIAAYEQLKKRGPRYWPTLSMLYTSAGKTTQAERAAEQALKDLTKRSKQQPENIAISFMRAEAAASLKKFPEALESLLTGLKLAEPKDRIKLRQGIAMLYCSWHDATPEEESEKRLELLNEAMKYGPDVSRVLSTLTRVANEAGEDPTQYKILEDAIIEGRAPAAVHFVLGTSALEKGEFTNAQTHLEIVVEHQPQAVNALNNLAWALAHMEQPDLERAETLANQAVRLRPNDTRIIDTRARILDKAGDTMGAIHDYEKINRIDPGKRETYERLAALYEKAGLKDLSKRFQEKVDSLPEQGDS